MLNGVSDRLGIRFAIDSNAQGMRLTTPDGGRNIGPRLKLKEFHLYLSGMYALASDLESLGDKTRVLVEFPERGQADEAFKFFQKAPEPDSNYAVLKSIIHSCMEKAISFTQI